MSYVTISLWNATEWSDEMEAYLEHLVSERVKIKQ